MPGISLLDSSGTPEEVHAGFCELPPDQGNLSRYSISGLLEHFLVTFHVSYDSFDSSCLGGDVLHLDCHRREAEGTGEPQRL